MLFIPNEKATSWAIRNGKYHERMQEFGFQRDNIHVLDFDDPAPFGNLPLDVLYISGGNTFETLQRIRDCGFDENIVRYVESGVTYIGGSAGAHIVTKNLAHIIAFDPPPDDVTDFSGLGLFDGVLICHYTPKRNAVYEQLKKAGKYKVYALTDDDSIVVET